MNELCFANNIKLTVYEIPTSFKPNSINDILIISRKNGFIITPDSIMEIKDNIIIVDDKRLSNKEELFVTYKY